MRVFESREEYLEFLNGELDATAEEWAHGLHELVAKQMSETFTNALIDTMADEGLDQEFGVESDSLVLGGMRCRVYEHLARLCHEAGQGWGMTVTSALTERFPESD